MRVLVTWGSKRGGTEGIARFLAQVLRDEGLDVVLLPPREAAKVRGFDAAIVGGALYASRWHRAARSFVRRSVRQLRGVPVWFFSSGPLDDSALEEPFRLPLAALCLFAGITAIAGGAVLMLRPDGSIANAPLALLQHSPFPDFLVPGLLLAGVVGVLNTVAGILLIRRRSIADAATMVSGLALTIWIVVEVAFLRSFHWLHAVYLLLGVAIQAIAVVRAERDRTLGTTVSRLGRLFVHTLVGWAVCGATMGALLALTNLSVALVGHAFAAPLIFTVVSASYFRAPSAVTPLATAIVFTFLVALLDLVIVAGFVERSLAMFTSFAGTWLPFLLIFAATWATGALTLTLPAPTQSRG